MCGGERILLIIIRFIKILEMFFNAKLFECSEAGGHQSALLKVDIEMKRDKI